jgi:phosphoribosylaminoimidazole-succinocarboxamide synthase
MTKKTTQKGNLVYEGKAKQLFEGPDAGTLIQHFKDDVTAFNNEKHEVISGKGILNNRISEFVMLRLMEMGIPTHFIRSLNMREQLIKAVEIIPVEVIVRNRAAGSFSKRFKIDEGDPMPYPIVEYNLKSDDLGDPLITEEHIFALDLADPQEMDEVYALALRINDYLSGLFRGIGFNLIDFKIEFGRIYTEEGLYIVLADEISPDSCRLWDVDTDKRYDKDLFRHGTGDITEAYREVARRLGVLPEAEVLSTIQKTVKPTLAKKRPAKPTKNTKKTTKPK